MTIDEATKRLVEMRRMIEQDLASLRCMTAEQRGFLDRQIAGCMQALFWLQHEIKEVDVDVDGGRFTPDDSYSSALNKVPHLRVVNGSLEL